MLQRFLLQPLYAFWTTAIAVTSWIINTITYPFTSLYRWLTTGTAKQLPIKQTPKPLRATPASDIEATITPAPATPNPVPDIEEAITPAPAAPDIEAAITSPPAALTTEAPITPIPIEEQPQTLKLTPLLHIPISGWHHNCLYAATSVYILTQIRINKDPDNRLKTKLLTAYNTYFETTLTLQDFDQILGQLNIIDCQLVFAQPIRDAVRKFHANDLTKNPALYYDKGNTQTPLLGLNDDGNPEETSSLFAICRTFGIESGAVYGFSNSSERIEQAHSPDIYISNKDQSPAACTYDLEGDVQLKMILNRSAGHFELLLPQQDAHEAFRGLKIIPCHSLWQTLNLDWDSCPLYKYAHKNTAPTAVKDEIKQYTTPTPSIRPS